MAFEPPSSPVSDQAWATIGAVLLSTRDRSRACATRYGSKNEHRRANALSEVLHMWMHANDTLDSDARRLFFLHLSQTLASYHMRLDIRLDEAASLINRVLLKGNQR